MGCGENGTMTIVMLFVEEEYRIRQGSVTTPFQREMEKHVPVMTKMFHTKEPLVMDG